MSAPQEIVDLVERFERNREAYTSGQYNETQLRREFLDPFFEVLGWDVNNKKGHAEAYKDVIHEDAIKIGGYTKAPDYCFRIGGVRKFFVEAKKPSVNLKDDINPAFQLRRYAWSARLPLSILTDFEEFVVYDCRIKPDKTDKPATARILYSTFSEYQKRWDEISAIFSCEAILKGSFDKYVESRKNKKGTAEVDAAFLKEIESWRELLARNIALRNSSLTQRELNFAVQQTIDRIIFLRICEDRGIETYNSLMAVLNGTNVYQRLCQLFRRADDKYNSGLFHFTREKERREPDELTLHLTIDDSPLKDIIKSLYYPDCPYEFSVLPADILGQVYEQFLGKVIRLTEGHRAVVEDKPEVKKAGGVYYTPTYIVDYIVKNTVGKLLEEKTPRKAANLKILDPACGSGSFLIGAFQYLLDWHLQWYSANDPESWKKKKAPPIFDSPTHPFTDSPNKNYRLTTSEKKRILLNNIYGVDIDPQAVEVTKLSLLLKVLEGESGETLSNQLRLLAERALPDLGSNIKCGNSLIGPDFYTPLIKGGQRGVTMPLPLLDDEERYRINVFDWEKEFPEVFNASQTKSKHSPSPSTGEGRGEGGGFDAVIGNPPYIRIQALKEWAPVEVEFYKQRFDSAKKGNYDIYVVFVEKGLNLLNSKGVLGFILPHKFFNAQYGEPLREKLSKGKHLAQVVHFGDKQIFEGATTYTCLMFLRKSGADYCKVIKVDDLNEWKNTDKANEDNIPISCITQSEWNFSLGKSASLLERLASIPLKLENVTSRIFQGIKTSADKIYIVDELEGDAHSVKIFSREKNAQYRLEPDLLHPLIKGGDSKRYCLSRTKRLILFPYEKQSDGKSALIPEKIFKAHYPLTWAYLLENKEYLEDRENGKMRHDRWYGYIYPKALDVMPLPKIFTPDIASRASFSLDQTGEVFFTGGVAGGYGMLVLPEYSREYVLGLVNSKLLEWIIYQTATQMRGGYYSFESRFIRNLPIRTIDFSAPADKARYDKMVELVEQMLSLHKQLAAAKTAHEKNILQRQIDATDRQIDNLVYELYGLTEEEIGIVEGV